MDERTATFGEPFVSWYGRPGSNRCRSAFHSCRHFALFLLVVILSRNRFFKRKRRGCVVTFCDASSVLSRPPFDLKLTFRVQLANILFLSFANRVCQAAPLRTRSAEELVELLIERDRPTPQMPTRTLARSCRGQRARPRYSHAGFKPTSTLEQAAPLKGHTLETPI